MKCVRGPVEVGQINEITENIVKIRPKSELCGHNTLLKGKKAITHCWKNMIRRKKSVTKWYDDAIV